MKLFYFYTIYLIVLIFAFQYNFIINNLLKKNFWSNQIINFLDGNCICTNSSCLGTPPAYSKSNPKYCYWFYYYFLSCCLHLSCQLSWVKKISVFSFLFFLRWATITWHLQKNFLNVVYLFLSSWDQTYFWQTWYSYIYA